MSLSSKSNNEITLLWGASIRNPNLRLEIENEIRRRIPNNFIISKEQLFSICRTYNRSVNVHFLPTTSSYNVLGEYITLVDLELNQSEVETLLLNVTNGVVTNGIVQCQMLNDTSDLEMTSIVKFNTNEVSHIEY